MDHPFQRRADQALHASRLGSLDDATLYALRQGEIRLDVSAGTILPLPCDEPHVGIVVEGMFRVSVGGPDGRLLTLRYLRSAELIGVPSIIGEAATIADFRAVVDTSVVLFDVRVVRSLAERDPAVALALAAELASMVRIAVGELASTAFRSVRQRVARHLLDLAISNDRHGRSVARVSQQELAEAVGSVREVVSRTLGQMRAEGVVGTGSSGIVVLDPDRLCDVAIGEGDDDAVSALAPLGLAAGA
jgi:CRP/FNR family transcriptional regulator